jgi:DNA transposition AAA+ family ATPase
MTNEQKLQVKDALMRYIACFDTQAEAANNLNGVSPAIISQVKNNNWDMISERLWQHIARQVGFYGGQWHAADTSTSLLLRILLSDAQHYCMSYGIAIARGLGKTFTATQYARKHDHVIYICANSTHNRRSFIAELLYAVGIKPSGTMPDMINSFSATFTAKDAPLLIVDDAHLLKDRVLQLLVAITNTLTGKAGVVLMGTEELITRITEGTQEQKTGFDRIYDTLGRRFITLNSLNPKDIEVICRANNLDEDSAIMAVAEACNGNLHNINSHLTRIRLMKIAA